MLANGVLPPGLELDMDTGAIAGTPVEAGAFAFTVVAMNEANDVRRASLVILVEDPTALPPPPDNGGCICLTTARSPWSSLGLLGLLGLMLRRRRLR